MARGERPIQIDRTARQQLREALDAAEAASSTSCGFFACPGPDKPFVAMATCNVCRTVQVLRRLAMRLGVIGADDCACCRMFPQRHLRHPCQECGHTSKDMRE